MPKSLIFAAMFLLGALYRFALFAYASYTGADTDSNGITAAVLSVLSVLCIIGYYRNRPNTSKP